MEKRKKNRGKVGTIFVSKTRTLCTKTSKTEEKHFHVEVCIHYDQKLFKAKYLVVFMRQM